MTARQRYRSVVADSERWNGFPLRDGDIVISPPPKCGTTWLQTLCALLVLDGATPDRPLAEVSPWLDMLPLDLGAVTADLAVQGHRRFIKSHTPLDGLPRREGVTYLCIGRDPRDVVLSYVNHMRNLSDDIIMYVLANAGPDFPPPPDIDDPPALFRQWIEAPYSPDDRTGGDSLAELVHHLRTFWDRRDEDGVALFHYDDLHTDLPGQIRRLAAVLGIEVDDGRVAAYAGAATFERMRERADELVPNAPVPMWRDNRQFFNRGSSGQWRGVFAEDDLRRYDERLAELAPPGLVGWLHAGWSGAA